MAESNDDVQELLDRAGALEYGPTKTAMIEEAVRVVDTHGDIPRAYEVRQELITASSFGGQPDLTLVHFSWCLAQFDRDPERFNTHSLLWKYKWVIGKLSSFPQISRAQIEEMLADMERRYRAYGATLHAVYNKRRSVAMEMGDVDAAVEAHAKMGKTARDSLSDCLACVADELVVYLRFRNQTVRAVKEGIALIESNLTCGEVPDVTFGLILVPLLKLNRPDEAMAYHRTGYPMNARNPGRLGAAIRHLEFLSLTDNHAEAIKLVQKHMPVALATVDLNDRFEFLRVGTLVFRRLHDSGKESIKLKMPEDWGLADAKGKYSTATLAREFQGKAVAIAEKFDARNGNDCYRKKIDALEKLQECAIPVPIPGRSEE